MMIEESKQKYLDKVGAQLEECGVKFDVVKARVAQGAADGSVDYNCYIEDWQKKESFFKEKIEEIRSAGADSFESLKAKAQTAWDDLSTLMQSFGEKV